MNNQDVKNIVGDTPCMSLDQARKITSFMEKHSLQSVIELGFAHGVSTCYMAAALGRMQGGTIVTIDQECAREREPRIETLLAAVGELDRVNIFYEPTSYTWRLMKLLEENPRPSFNLCYLDGAHNWFIDGFAFYLVSMLIEPGGWIIFDDIGWSYSISPSLKNTEEVKAMPADERDTKQVKKVWELLVKTHPNFHNFMLDGNWGYAQKRDKNSASIVEP